MIVGDIAKSVSRSSKWLLHLILGLMDLIPQGLGLLSQVYKWVARAKFCWQLSNWTLTRPPLLSLSPHRLQALLPNEGISQYALLTCYLDKTPHFLEYTLHGVNKRIYSIWFYIKLLLFVSYLWVFRLLKCNSLKDTYSCLCIFFTLNAFLNTTSFYFA